MPDEHTLNAVLSSYGASGLLNSNGGINWWGIIGGTIFGIIGWCAFNYGRKEKSARPMMIGIALMVYPFFIPNPVWIFVIGAAMTALLYFWRE